MFPMRTSTRYERLLTEDVNPSSFFSDLRQNFDFEFDFHFGTLPPPLAKMSTITKFVLPSGESWLRSCILNCYCGGVLSEFCFK